MTPRLAYLTSLALGFALAACGGSAPPSTPATVPAPVPRSATAAGIAEADLRLRLGIVAHDSMMGREAGEAGNVKGTDYIAAELGRLGLEPAGENGTFFQAVPLVRTGPRPDGFFRAAGRELRLGDEYVYLGELGDLPIGRAAEFQGVAAVYGGRVGDTVSVIPAEQAAGKVVVIGAPLGRDGKPVFRFDGRVIQRYQGARALAIAVLDLAQPELREFLSQPQTSLASDEEEPPASTGPMLLFVTADAAGAILGRPVAGALPGSPGAAVDARLGIARTPVTTPARNVVAILRGTDPALRNTYVAIGAHNDHVGLTAKPVDHDSLRAWNRVMRPQGAENQPGEPSAAEAARIAAILDTLRRARPARTDSVFNGADDDGSGTVAVLEAAEAFARDAAKPRRSVLFVWHSAEELGLLGATWFTDHPTVPRDSIVAQLNIDMIGRGAPGDVPGGGPGYLQLIGSRRLSKQLGDLVEAANREGGHGFTFDYQYDAVGHPQQFYCRSDHYAYARFGIPITFFTTGSHTDYHQLTDEVEYIDFRKLESVTRLIHDIATRLANLPTRPALDGPKPDPEAPCQQ